MVWRAFSKGELVGATSVFLFRKEGMGQTGEMDGSVWSRARSSSR